MTTTAKKSLKSPSHPASRAQPKPDQQRKRLAKASAKKPEKPKPSKAPAPAIESAPAATQKLITKRERVLTLLSRTDGANIEEMMKATDWQQHSVRGFLAGTVKKKLGFTLVSSKEEGKPRRYRIDKRRGR
jgi:hypothetical protein